MRLSPKVDSPRIQLSAPRAQEGTLCKKEEPTERQDVVHCGKIEARDLVKLPNFSLGLGASVYEAADCARKVRQSAPTNAHSVAARGFSLAAEAH